jgi:PAS domain S-box-containing protein
MLIFDICIILSLIIAVVITFVSISRNIYEVFPYFYLIPVVLIAYSRPKLSIFITVLVGWLYLALVYLFGLPDTRLFTLATVWFYIFVSLGVLVSAYSKEYREEEVRSYGAFFSSQAGAFSFDKDALTIKETNRKFEQMIGYERDELKKMALPDIMPDEKERMQFLEKIHDTHRIGDIEIQLFARDGSTRWALISAVETEEPAIICTLVDITPHRQAEKSLEQANRKLNLLNSITRHDILNQLTALIGYLDLSREDTHDPKMLRFISKEGEAAEAIKRQILFTRDYQNIGVHSPKWQNVAETVSLAIAAANLSHVRVTVRIPPIEIYADPLLEKVFYNLMENSVRHGGHVTEISILSQESANGLTLIVEDNGTGVPDERKEQIFRREYFKNTGFGLFLSQEILSITGLTIRENGTSGKGARFEIHAQKNSYRIAKT